MLFFKKIAFAHQMFSSPNVLNNILLNVELKGTRFMELKFPVYQTCPIHLKMQWKNLGSLKKLFTEQRLLIYWFQTSCLK